MDADCIQRRREQNPSQREKRWSMNSQRLEEIVAELMKPISDVRRSFDTDLSALLEEYLTEAGLHALEAGEGGEGEGGAAPNFAELALLLQHSACVYGRKVDCLYQHVLSVSDSLHSAAEGRRRRGGADAEREPAQAQGVRGGCGGCGGAGFAAIALEASASARREAERARPPPTLPRVHVELEPRGAALLARLPALRDYDGEPIGLLPDFHVAWRLQNGLLVEELEEAEPAAGGTQRPPPLDELHAALLAAAPPEPPPARCSTPEPRDADTEEAPRPVSALDLSDILRAAPRGERKRRRAEPLDQPVRLLIDREVRRKLKKIQEFSIEEEWISSVVDTRKRRVLALRRRLHPTRPELRGFHFTDAIDIGGFRGWSPAEVAAVAAQVAAAAARVAAVAAAGGKRAEESDDDGFFEQSSLGDSLSDDSPHTTTSGSGATGGPWSQWQSGVLQRAARAEARALDVRAVAARLLRRLRADQPGQPPPALPALPALPAMPCARLLADARDPADVSHMFLATLFLANSGNIEVVQGAPLTLNSFSVRLVSSDERLYRAAAAEHCAPR